MKLLTPAQLRRCPAGTRLKSIMGRVVVKSAGWRDYDTRAGVTAYGLAPKPTRRVRKAAGKR